MEFSSVDRGRKSDGLWEYTPTEVNVSRYLLTHLAWGGGWVIM